MTRERAKELLPVIQAFADGKEVEFRLSDSDRWLAVRNLPCADDCEYRIKPTPREWWAVVIGRYPSGLYSTRADAEKYSCSVPGREVVRVKEVE